MASTELGQSSFSGLFTELVSPTDGIIPKDTGKTELVSSNSVLESSIQTVDQLSLATSEVTIPPTSPTHLYRKFRGYYAVGSVYETWVTTDFDGTIPPSGHSLSGTSLVASWIS